jgi:TfoX/Sxy family transcriptional regulator of competence genes
MAYDEILAERVQQALGKSRKAMTRKMMGGLIFMVDAKMCVGVFGKDLMLRLDPVDRESALKKKVCREMEFKGRPTKSFILVGPAGTKSEKDLAGWIALALDFNKRPKASGKRNA